MVAAIVTDLAAFAVGVPGVWEYLRLTLPLPHRARLSKAARLWAAHRTEYVGVARRLVEARRRDDVVANAQRRLDGELQKTFRGGRSFVDP